MIYPCIPEPSLNPPEPKIERDPFWYDEALEEEKRERNHETPFGIALDEGSPDFEQE